MARLYIKTPWSTDLKKKWIEQLVCDEQVFKPFDGHLELIDDPKLGVCKQITLREYRQCVPFGNFKRKYY